MKVKIILAALLFCVQTIAQVPILVSNNGYKQVESSVAVHPSNSDISAVATIEFIPAGRQCLIYLSSDNGQNWSLKKSINDATDPVIEFDNNGNLFFAYLHRSELEVYIIKSTNFGVTWSAPLKVSNITGNNEADKEWIAIDQNNNIYLTWWETLVEASVLKFSRSTDGGTSFSAPINLHLLNQNSLNFVAPFIAVNPSGNIYISVSIVHDYGDDYATFDIGLLKSTDGGLSFNTLQIVDGGLIPPGYYDGPGDQPRVLKLQETNDVYAFRVDPFTSLVVNNQNIYILVSHRESKNITPGLTLTDNSDLIIYKSTNDGISWDTKRIYDYGTNFYKNNGDQFFPSLAMTASGELYCFFYNSLIEGSMDNLDTKMSIAYSNDYAESFSIFDATYLELFDPSVGSSKSLRFNGDYIQLKASSDRVVMSYSKPEGASHKLFFHTLDLSNDITIYNDVNGQTTLGFIKVDNQENYNLPNTLPLPLTNHSIEAQNLISDWKFYKWESDLEPPIDNSRNVNENFISNFDKSINSEFQLTKPLTIRNYFEGGDGHNITFGEIGFDVSNRTSPINENAFIYSPPDVLANYKATVVQTYASIFNTDWTFQKWENGSTSLTRQAQISQSSPSVWRAIYKGISKSDNSTAYSLGGQNKIVKTNNDYLHFVYESLGKVWYERSTNNGASWEIMNNGLPLYVDEAKFPSIDNSDSDIFITYQDSHNRIYLHYFDHLGDQLTHTISSVSQYNEFDATPVISVGRLGKIVVVWKKIAPNPLYGQSALYYWVGEVVPPSVLTYDSGVISNTNESSYNPTLTTGKYYPMDANTFHLAWQQGSSAVKYYRLVWESQEEELFAYNYAEPSYGASGYSDARKPSISMYGGYPIIGWVSQETGTEIDRCLLRIRFSSSSWSPFYSYGYSHGDNIEVVNINEGGNYDFILAWGGDSRYDQYLKSNSTTNIYTLSSVGDVQVSNGSGFSGMRIQSFDKYNAPHDFTLSGTDGMLKSNSYNFVSVGREFNLLNEGLTVRSGISDVKVDGNRIPFVGEDSFLDNSLLGFESKLETESFMLTNNSEFTFSFNHNVSVLTPAALTTSNSVNIKVMLVDAQTDETIGVLHENIIDGTQQILSGVNNFLVNTSGIGEREVKLKIKVKDKLKNKSDYTVTTRVISEGGELEKANYEEITYKGEEPVTSYELAQNYPNPFNPSTTIKYQIPNAGNVSLKIYDVLGAEVMTLVNTTQAKGRYEVNFDASQLSSGVYIYRIQSNDYVASRKMILLK